jgi:hypothetical protein
LTQTQLEFNSRPEIDVHYDDRWELLNEWAVITERASRFMFSAIFSFLQIILNLVFGALFETLFFVFQLLEGLLVGLLELFSDRQGVRFEAGLVLLEEWRGGLAHVADFKLSIGVIQTICRLGSRCLTVAIIIYPTTLKLLQASADRILQQHHSTDCRLPYQNVRGL